MILYCTHNMALIQVKCVEKKGMLIAEENFVPSQCKHSKQASAICRSFYNAASAASRDSLKLLPAIILSKEPRSVYMKGQTADAQPVDQDILLSDLNI